MSNINTVSLFNQMQTMAAQAEGTGLAVGDIKSPFSMVFQNALHHVSQLNQDADSLKTRYEFNDPDVSIAEVMIATQKSNIGLEATLRVRNKIVQAYQDIMSMPV